MSVVCSIQSVCVIQYSLQVLSRMGLNVASRQSIQPDDRHLHRQFDTETCRW